MSTSDHQSTHDLDVDPQTAPLVAELVDRFALADRHGAIARTRSLVRERGLPPRAVRDLVCRAQRHVGTLWHTGQWSITQEHAATAVAEAVLAALDDLQLDEAMDRYGTRTADLRALGNGDDRSAEGAGAVAVVTADGEWHGLPVRLAAQAIREAGLRAVLLGASLPAGDLDRALPALRVDALAVGVTLASHLPGAARSVRAGRNAGLPVLLGGRGASPERARRLGATGYAPDAETGADLIGTWLTEGVPVAGEPDLQECAAEALRTVRGDLVAQAFAETERRWPTLAVAPELTIDRVIEDLQLLVDHLVAAVLVDDDALLAEFLTWLGALHTGRGLPPTLLWDQVDALLVGLEAHPAAQDLLLAARR